ncbi:MAG: carbohydrate binding family 9 domain-containing protein [Armatimonadota bacterium]
MPAVKAAEPPKIDGDVSDPVWATAPKASGFVDRMLGMRAPDDTFAWILYDSEYIYVAFHAFDSQPDAIVAREIRRDAQMWSGEDTFTFVIDTFHSHRFDDISTFTVNAIGTQASRIGGGRAGKVEWKGDWEAAVKRVPNGWAGEMRIPWRILNYPPAKGPVIVGLNFERRQERTKIWSMWSNIGPRFQQELAGHWEGVELPFRDFKPSVSWLPYLSSGVRDGFTPTVNLGLDARLTLTPQLVGVATLNPDFANIEGAVEGIDFSRSARFVPDARPFFLEGNDVFDFDSRGGIGNFFHSRQIPRFDVGAKVYGKVGTKNTLGLLLTSDIGNRTDAVVRIRRDINEVSNSNLMVVHVDGGPNGRNTVLANSQNLRWGQWRLETQFASSLGRDAGASGGSVGAGYEGRYIRGTLRYLFIAPDFLATDGYIPFTDYRGPSLFMRYENEWRTGWLRRAQVRWGGSWQEHYDGRRFRRTGFAEAELETRKDLLLRLGIDGGTFENERDLVGTVGFRTNVSNRFKTWGVTVSFGKRADHPITYVTPAFSFRVVKKLDIGLDSSILWHIEDHYQHIIQFNWEIDSARSIGGRVVISDAGTNGFISYKRSGYAGVDTYIILGDPNAQKFTKRFITKLVWPL